MRAFLVLAGLLGLLPVTSHAVIRSVPGAYPTIQAAVDACAAFGDVVEVGTGYYKETVLIVSKEIAFQPATGATVQVDRFEWSNPTEVGSGGRITGFEILNGILATDIIKFFGLSDCTVHGGMEVRGTYFSSAIEDCVFDGDVAVRDETFWTSTSATIARCVFNGGQLSLSMRLSLVYQGQFTDAGIGISASSGTANNNNISNGSIQAWADGGSADIIGNTLTGGTGSVFESGISAASTKGASIWIQGNTLLNCGGVLMITSGNLGTNATVEDNVLCNCSSGVDIRDDWGLREVRNNTITQCAGNGFNVEGRALLSDVFTQNISSENAIGVRVNYAPGPGTFNCNDVWNNPGGNWVGMTDPTGTDDNISDDPEFCSPADCDLTLRVDSPCLPGASPCGLLIGALDEDCTPTATEPSTWGAVKIRHR